MVRVFINHHAVAVPIPVIAIPVLNWGHREVVAVKPEPVRASTSQDPYVPGPKSADKVAVLPGMIEMVATIIAARVVSHPSAVRVDMGRVRVAFAVIKMAVIRVMPVPVVVVATVPVWSVFGNVFVMVAVSTAIVVTIAIPVLSKTISGH